MHWHLIRALSSTTPQYCALVFSTFASHITHTNLTSFTRHLAYLYFSTDHKGPWGMLWRWSKQPPEGLVWDQLESGSDEICHSLHDMSLASFGWWTQTRPGGDVYQDRDSCEFGVVVVVMDRQWEKCFCHPRKCSTCLKFFFDRLIGKFMRDMYFLKFYEDKVHFYFFPRCHSYASVH